MLREIVLDTETTGTDPAKGDRVIEIGCVEMLNHIPTGKSYHVYINPECPVSSGAFAVHGLSDEILAEVYIELIGGRQVGFDLSLQPSSRRSAAAAERAARDAKPRILISRLTEAERTAHEAFIQSIGPSAIWREYIG